MDEMKRIISNIIQNYFKLMNKVEDNSKINININLNLDKKGQQ